MSHLLPAALADQATIARVRQATRDADAVLRAGAAEPAGALADLAERTTEVLAAYRQLRRDVVAADDWEIEPP